MTIATMTNGMAMAREPDPRLPTITFLRPAARPTTVVPTALAMSLSNRDRMLPGRSRSRAARIDVGPLLVSLGATRLRSASHEDETSSDRLSVMTVGGDAGLGVAPGLSLHAFSTAMRMRRRLGMLPGTRAFGSSATTLGIGAVREGVGMLTLDYTNVAAPRERGALGRMADRIGGGNSVGSGARLMLAGGDARRIGWTVSMAALRRSFDDSRAISLDRRAEIAFRMAL